MFDRTLGVYPHEKIHIDIDPNAKPVHSRPYPVPRIHLKNFKMELDHLVRLGVVCHNKRVKGLHLHSSPPKRTAEYAGLVTYVNCAKSFNASNICCQ
jgi:hypothetical protein